MAQVSVSGAQAKLIGSLIAGFADDAPAERKWQCEYVQRYQALPLYIGWTETIGIRTDGTLVRWSTEDDWPGVRDLAAPIWLNIALVQGAKTYPTLAALIPQRPPTAITCDGCAGSGTIPNLDPNFRDLVCKCGGIGWLPLGAE